MKWHAVKQMKKNGRTTRKRERDNATPTKERGEAGPTGYFKFINFMACQKKGMVAPRPGGRAEKKHPKARKTPPHKKEEAMQHNPKEGEGRGEVTLQRRKARPTTTKHKRTLLHSDVVQLDVV